MTVPAGAKLKITHGSTVTYFAESAPWPFMLPSPGLDALWDVRDVEVVDREIAGADDASYPVVEVSSRRTATAQVFGDYDLNGAYLLHGQRSNLRDLMSHLRTNVLAPITSGDGTVTLEMFDIDGISCGTAAAKFVGPMRPVAAGPISRVITLDLLFPSDLFAF